MINRIIIPCRQVTIAMLYYCDNATSMILVVRGPVNQPGLYLALLRAGRDGVAAGIRTSLVWTVQTAAACAGLVCAEETGARVGLAVAEEAGVRLSLRLRWPT